MRVSLLLLLLGALCQHGHVAEAATAVSSPSAMVSSLSALGKASNKYFSFFGFGSSGFGRELMQALRGSASLGEGTIILDIDNDSESGDLYELGGSSYGVGFVNMAQLVGRREQLLSDMVAYIESAYMHAECESSKATKKGKRVGDDIGRDIPLVILVSHSDVGGQGASDSAVGEVEGLVGTAFELVSSATGVPVSELRGKVAVSIVSYAGSSIQDAANVLTKSLESHSNTMPAVAASTLVKSISGSKAKALPTSTREQAMSVSFWSSLVSDFVETFTKRLEAVLPTKLPPASMLAALANKETLQTLLADASIVTYDKRPDLFDATAEASPDLAVQSAYLARVKVGTALAPVYKAAMEALLKTSLDSFDKTMRKVMPDSSLVQGLKKQAAIAQKAFIEQAYELKASFESALVTVAPNGLLADALLPGATHREFSLKPLSKPYAFNGYVQLLRKDLAEKCAERERALFLQGIYNPYLRSLPFPPTHLNFNYLLDPRKLIFDSKYDPLFDPHGDKVVQNRANPLHIDGVSHVPMSPNDLPEGPPKPSFVSKVRNFIFEDWDD